MVWSISCAAIHGGLVWSISCAAMHNRFQKVVFVVILCSISIQIQDKELQQLFGLAILFPMTYNKDYFWEPALNCRTGNRPHQTQTFLFKCMSKITSFLCYCSFYKQVVSIHVYVMYQFLLSFIILMLFAPGK